MGTTEERWVDGIIASMDMNLSKLQEMVKDKKAWCAVVHGIEKSWTRPNNDNKNVPSGITHLCCP